MTTQTQCALKCPCCDEAFETDALTSLLIPTNIFGESTDLRPQTGDDLYIHISNQTCPFSFYTIQSCSACGFTWDTDDFEKVTLTDALKDKIINDITLKVKKEELTPQKKYELLAKIYKLMEASSLDIAGAYLNAAWCCVSDEDDEDFILEEEVGEANKLLKEELKEEENLYRKEAIRYLRIALSEKDVVAQEERAKLTYLVGELYRRIGDTQRAHAFFDMVADEIIWKKKQRWILNLAEQQKYAPDDLIKDAVFEGDEHDELRALFEKAAAFFGNSSKMRADVRTNDHIDYRTMVHKRRRVRLRLFQQGTALRIVFEKKWVAYKNLCMDFLSSLEALDKADIEVTDNRERVTISVGEDTSIDAMDEFLGILDSCLIEKLETFED